MSDESEPKVTRQGLFEELVGKTKEAAGELVGNEDLAEAGREQQIEAEMQGDSSEQEDEVSDDTEGG